MINRIYKIINIKFPRLLKFVFFLRYLFLVFLCSLTIFLTIPNFFDFNKREGVIRSYFLQNYKININKIDNIKYNFFPLPHLELRNFNAKLFSKETSLNTISLLKDFMFKGLVLLFWTTLKRCDWRESLQANCVRCLKC